MNPDMERFLAEMEKFSSGVSSLVAFCVRDGDQEMVVRLLEAIHATQAHLILLEYECEAVLNA